MIPDGEIILLECKCVKSQLRVLPCNIVLVNARKRKKRMVCGFIGMRSLQDQFAPEFPMVGTCDLRERDSTEEVK